MCSGMYRPPLGASPRNTVCVSSFQAARSKVGTSRGNLWARASKPSAHGSSTGAAQSSRQRAQKCRETHLFEREPLFSSSRRKVLHRRGLTRAARAARLVTATFASLATFSLRRIDTCCSVLLLGQPSDCREARTARAQHTRTDSHTAHSAAHEKRCHTKHEQEGRVNDV